MAKDSKIKSVLVIGSGPIVIGQACEFDYSGTQACRVLKSEGIRVILINSNPATIMTDPEFADATYIEPITPESIEQILIKEKPDAVLATLGGQTALNAAMGLHEKGILQKYGVQLIGADVDAIQRGENRELFRAIVEKVGGESAKSIICHTMQECFEAVKTLNFPVVVRPSFTMGGLGSGIAFNSEELELIAGAGLRHSPTSEVLLEESILGWKEYELEVMRDRKDNVVIVCSIENLDPMGVHTGDSITVAPALTLTDVEFQRLRNLAINIIREVGVDTGGCNIQFAVNPQNGRIVVIEMNPRVSRSSALASKATGFPIAKIATKLAIGYTLDEIQNDITKVTPASFEPTLDYIVVKVPRFAFEKFADADPRLTTTMKSVGEAMAIGRSFPEALQKALRSLERKEAIFQFPSNKSNLNIPALLELMRIPTEYRLQQVQQALWGGASIQAVHEATKIDPWYLEQISLLNAKAEELSQPGELSFELLYSAKQLGFSDQQIAGIRNLTYEDVKASRIHHGIRPVYKTVDTCAAEFEAFTPYHYSTYEDETEVKPRTKPAVIILGSGPNRIGQGIEFDYSCVHASFTLRDAGFETIMINCNPETVSTDYDTSDRLYFEPLTLEDVLEVVAAEEAAGPVLGVIATLGGQTPLGLAQGLKDAGVEVLGTSPDAINLAEERGAFGLILQEQGLTAPEYGMASSLLEAQDIAARISYPVLVRPSFVLGGRGMEIVYDDQALAGFISRATEITPGHPVLVDRFLDNAIEIDVDALFDGNELFMGGVMEHIEEAGIHSGDSACVLPAITITENQLVQIREATEKIARGVNVRGLINIQYALSNGHLYVLEANPRASRTVPFVSKATGQQLAKIAARCMAGQSLTQQGIQSEVKPPYFSVKEAVFPFNKFPGIDPILGPEMRSTGEVMGVGKTFGEALFKSQLGAFIKLPKSATVLLTVKDSDKPKAVEVAKLLHQLGFPMVATKGTAAAIEAAGLPVRLVNKVKDGRPHIVDFIKNGEISLVFTTVDETRTAIADSRSIRTSAQANGVTYYTTISAARAVMDGLLASQNGSKESLEVYSLQNLHQKLN